MGQLSFSSFFFGQLLESRPPVQPVDLTGKTVCIVGANVGLGFEAAKHFAKMRPAKLILGCRSLEKGKAALRELEEETSFDRAEVQIIDLGQFTSVKAFAEKMNKENTRLDILLMNAGAASSEYQVTPDGWENQLQVNYLSTAFTSLLLLPLMQKTAKEHSVAPRLVVVASEVHYWAKEEPAYKTTQSSFLKVLSSKEYSTPQVMRNRYQVSKLFNVLFVRALQSRLGLESPIVVNSVNPGFCYSNLLRGTRGIEALGMKFIQFLIARSTEEGSRQLVWAALHGDDLSMKGAFLHNMQVKEPSDFAISKDGKDLEDRLWNETIDVLAEADPELRKIVADL